MIADSTELTPFATFASEGIITTDTFNDWRKKDNGIVQLFNELEAASTTNPNIILNLTSKALTIKASSIGTTLLTDVSVTEAKIANSSVTEGKIGTNAITTAKIADLNVTTAKIANLSITTAKIADLNVTTAKIADLGVTTAKIGDAQVTPGKVVSGGSYPIDVTGLAQKARQLIDAHSGLAVMNFFYAGQGGQPTWLWGSYDANTHAVWNPANFNVAGAQYAVNGVKSWLFVKNYGVQGYRSSWSYGRYGGGLGSWIFYNAEIKPYSAVMISGGGWNGSQQIKGVSLDEVGEGYCIIRSYGDNGVLRDAYCLSIAVFNQ